MVLVLEGTSESAHFELLFNGPSYYLRMQLKHIFSTSYHIVYTIVIFCLDYADNI